MKYSDIEDAFMFVSGSPQEENYAYVNKETGESYFISSFGESDELPDDLEENDKYLSVPHKNELNLGRDLVFDFVSIHLPGELKQVREIFNRKGAYSRYKDLLESRKMLQIWYEYEQKATEKALREWCRENNISLED